MDGCRRLRSTSLHRHYDLTGRGSCGAARMGSYRSTTFAAIAICVWWNLALTAEFGTSMMDRQKLELKRNAYDAFVTLPRIAPGLMYRYLTERASFYKPAEPAR